ncbi:MAG: hypothetical protein QM831_31350 [Kofleriaceae bacterium]
MRLACVIALAACDSGSGSAPKAADPHPVSPKSADAAPTCSTDGTYRLRYRSNNAEGWWMTIVVTGSTASVREKTSILGLAAGPVTMTSDPDCKLHFKATGSNAGDITIDLVSSGDTASGTISRTKGGEKYPTPQDTQPIAGWVEHAPPVLPACIHPGDFEIVIDQKAWKLTDGRPTPGLPLTCKNVAPDTKLTVRLTAANGQLFVNEVDAETHMQLFSVGTVTRDGDCKLTVAIGAHEVEKLEGAHLVFDGDTLTGTVDKADYDFYETEVTGENRWTCSAKHAALTGKRITD